MTDLLENINGPADLKKLSVSELKQLAAEIRRFIIQTTSKTGGHLGSNLGVVELTLALHYVFDFKTDKLLFDVGHQCYTHKIITGRKNDFELLRKKDGISGFPNPQESKYDQFTVGHAGTSIPTAAGIALGLQHNLSNEKVVAIIGDGSIVNGPSFEAMNNLNLVKRQMLIVLNDNSMAIDVTQGALAKYLSKVRLSHTYEDIRKTTNRILERLPVIGKGMEEALEGFKKSLRMAIRRSRIFESMNIPYFGPVDGHDIASLIELFQGLAHVNHPAILHVYTKKGMGYTPAIEEPSRFHSARAFDIENGSFEDSPQGEKSFTAAFGNALVELAQKDERIFAITSAMTDGTGLAKFRKKFPERFYDVGIAEEAAVDIASGLAKQGAVPVVCIYSTFLQRAFDQIAQEVSLQNLKVIFCLDRAGLVGADGPTHHGLMDIGFLRMLPNTVLLAPANEPEMKSALAFAIETPGAVAIRYPKDSANNYDGFDLSSLEKPFKLGKSVTVKKSDHSQAVIISYGAMLKEALKAAQLLEADGISVDIINARFAKPIDEAITATIATGRPVVTVEDHSAACGFGAALLEAVSRSKNKASVANITVLGIGDEFIAHDSRNRQLVEAKISSDNIAIAVKEALTRQKT